MLDGGAGDDVSLVGDEDDDVLIGGAGVTNQMTGGIGSDTVSYEDRNRASRWTLAPGRCPT